MTRACSLEPLPPLPGALADPERPVRTWWHKVEQRIGLDLRALALFRVAIAVVLFAEMWARLPWLGPFQTQDGLVPIDQLFGSLATTDTWNRWSLHTLNGTYGWQLFLAIAQGLAALALAVGWRTRLITIVCWVLIVSSQNRNTYLVNAGDTLLRCMLFWAMWMPLGARASIDAALDTEAVLDPAKRNNRWLGLSGIAFMLQLTLMYVCTAALKASPIWTDTWDAVRAALALDYLTTPLGTWLGGAPDWLLQGLCLGTLIAEWGAALLIWTPFFTTALRTLGVVMLCGMHIAFTMTMDIGLFSWIAVSCWLALLPPGFWDALFARWRDEPRRSVTLWFDADCGFCQKMALILRSLFLLPETAVRRGSDKPEIAQEIADKNSWVFEDSEGVHHHGWAGLVAMLRVSPWAFPLAWLAGLPGVRHVGEWLYRGVAKSRSPLGRLLAPFTYAPRRLAPTGLRWIAGVFLLGAITWVLLWNAMVFHNKKVPGDPDHVVRQVGKWSEEVINGPRPFTNGIRHFGQITRLAQAWTMFAPHPSTVRGWYIVRGERMDGEAVDLWRAVVRDEGVHPINLERPDDVRGMYPNARWRKFMMNLRSKSTTRVQRLRPLAAKWFARQWAERFEADHGQLKRVRIIFHGENVRSSGEIQPREPQLVWRYTVKRPPKPK